MSQERPIYPINTKKEAGNPLIDRRGFLARLAATFTISNFTSSANAKKSEEKIPKKKSNPNPKPKQKTGLEFTKQDDFLSQIEKRLFDFERGIKNRDLIKIREAKSLLEKTRHNLAGGEDREISIAYLENGEIKILSTGLMGHILNRNKGAKVRLEYNGASYFISLDFSNVDIGVANQFNLKKVGANKDLPIYAVKRAPYIKTKNKKGYAEESEIYVPPAKHLRTKENVEIGKKYIDFVIGYALEILIERLKSGNLSERIIQDFRYCASIVKRLSLVEHIDPVMFYRAEGDFKHALVDTTLTEYMANQKKAFAHLKNTSYANGMMQIISSTYEDIKMDLIGRNKFTNYELPEKDKGRENPVISGIIAINLCFRNYKDSIKPFLLRMEYNIPGIKINPENISECEAAIVACYNGSPELFKDAIRGYIKLKTVAKEVKSEKHESKKDSSVKRSKHEVSPQTLSKDLFSLLEDYPAKRGRDIFNWGPKENSNYLEKYRFVKAHGV